MHASRLRTCLDRFLEKTQPIISPVDRREYQKYFTLPDRKILLYENHIE